MSEYLVLNAPYVMGGFALPCLYKVFQKSSQRGKATEPTIKEQIDALCHRLQGVSAQVEAGGTPSGDEMTRVMRAVEELQRLSKGVGCSLSIVKSTQIQRGLKATIEERARQKERKDRELWFDREVEPLQSPAEFFAHLYGSPSEVEEFKSLCLELALVGAATADSFLAFRLNGALRILTKLSVLPTSEDIRAKAEYNKLETSSGEEFTLAKVAEVMTSLKENWVYFQEKKSLDTPQGKEAMAHIKVALHAIEQLPQRLAARVQAMQENKALIDTLHAELADELNIQKEVKEVVAQAKERSELCISLHSTLASRRTAFEECCSREIETGNAVVTTAESELEAALAEIEEHERRIAELRDQCNEARLRKIKALDMVAIVEMVRPKLQLEFESRTEIAARTLEEYRQVVVANEDFLGTCNIMNECLKADVARSDGTAKEAQLKSQMEFFLISRDLKRVGERLQEDERVLCKKTQRELEIVQKELEAEKAMIHFDDDEVNHPGNQYIQDLERQCEQKRNIVQRRMVTMGKWETLLEQIEVKLREANTVSFLMNRDPEFMTKFLDEEAASTRLKSNENLIKIGQLLDCLKYEFTELYTSITLNHGPLKENDVALSILSHVTELHLFMSESLNDGAVRCGIQYYLIQNPIVAHSLREGRRHIIHTIEVDGAKSNRFLQLFEKEMGPPSRPTSIKEQWDTTNTVLADLLTIRNIKQGEVCNKWAHDVSMVRQAEVQSPTVTAGRKYMSEVDLDVYSIYDDDASTVYSIHDGKDHKASSAGSPELH